MCSNRTLAWLCRLGLPAADDRPFLYGQRSSPYRRQARRSTTSPAAGASQHAE